MLEMRPDCEACGVDLHPNSLGAHICSFECTFCEECALAHANLCPNCGGELLPRPTRTGEMLMQYPASTTRHHKPK
ncbi:DUF1272 domain-containing protein [Aurantiacibacter suaedae]|uniref:DUF1272 domain-containing protein n=1 Tax=Aurantiacibacter suaedae TaxID=2545755 RepID=UPI0010F4CE85|nr:DUF1272 domain-containing protein [Aurantiacibacter suaedae]